MENLMQFAVSGIMTGSTYSLIALGIVMIYKSSKIFNFAVGEMVMLGAFLLWTFLDLLNLAVWVSLLSAVVLCGLVALAMERLAIHPLAGQPLLSTMLVTLGLADILRGLTMIFWGGTSERLREFLPGRPLIVGNIIIAHDLLWGFGIVIALFIGVYLFYRLTRVGLAMRAVAESHWVAQARGINVGTIFAVTWFCAGMVAAMGGILLGYRLGVQQFLALLGFKAFPGILFGGLESIGGALIGGIVVGLLENLTAGLITPWLGDITPYIALMIVLLIRPDGLFGLKRIERI